jgi:hypothetical protein
MSDDDIDLSDDEADRLLERVARKYRSASEVSKRTREIMKKSGIKPAGRRSSYPDDDGDCRLADALRRVWHDEYGKKLSRTAALRLAGKLRGADLDDVAVNRLRNKRPPPLLDRPLNMMVVMLGGEAKAAVAMFRHFHKKRPDLGILPIPVCELVVPAKVQK